ncbi:FAD-dependent oxidoreductase [Nocardia arthritidis]|uniref:FAD-dependent oxidoreductase n=1 Tax=Nocardia arthritidis TaxID=228602 RepID=A0A6G9YMA0_9NOCA|nr:FAD-dependent oxidoreductase [Nocardia arthritidis]QIS14409.1 FAD-dependent oxidoreductase [Nocardia arthritidis]
MTPLWLTDVSTPARLRVTPGLRFDTVVIGGGLTGLVTALLLAENGIEVAVVEARRIGAGTTGASTAKVSLLQGIRAQQIRRHRSGDTLRAYLDANLAAQRWIVDYCDTRGVPFQRADAFTYAQSESEIDSARAEYEVLRAAGVPVEFVERLDVPFPAHGAVRLADQVQLDPMTLLAALAADIEAHAAPIYESSPVRSVRNGADGDFVIGTEHAELRAGAIVLATGTPILDRGGFFARLVPQRSYLTAFRVAEPIPHGMYISAGEPTRSLRYTPAADGAILLVGGNGHVVGRATNTAELMDDLVAWTRRWFPTAEPVTAWSAQDYAPADELPYIGPLLPGNDGIRLGTGYAKWGMTNGVAAALALAGHSIGKTPEWAGALASWRPAEVKALPAVISANASVAQQFSKGWLCAGRADAQPPAEGCGRIERHLPHPTAVATVDGTATEVSAVCPHLYGIVRWNSAEKSWDCPLHGSRFAADGTLLEGPATRSLPQVCPPIPVLEHR